jgi:hypothetical protein
MQGVHHNVNVNAPLLLLLLLLLLDPIVLQAAGPEPKESTL